MPGRNAHICFIFAYVVLLFSQLKQVFNFVLHAVQRGLPNRTYISKYSFHVCNWIWMDIRAEYYEADDLSPGLDLTKSP